MIYFDNAATTHPKPPVVAEAVLRAIGEFGNPSRGSHAFALAAARCIERTRGKLATFFGCPSPERIAFTKSVTEALNIAVASIDGHIVATGAEHNSVLRPLYRRGNFSIAPVDVAGRFGVEDIAAQCRADTRAVVVGHASNLTGNIAPIAAIGRLCRERGMLFIVDAAQTAGLIDIDMEQSCIDALCFTGHKSLYGLQGTGGICVGDRFTPRPLIVGGSGSRTFDPGQPAILPDLLEAGTPNSYGIAALSAGLEYVMERSPGTLLAQASALERMFVQGLREIDGVILYGDYHAAVRMPIVSLNVGSIDSAEVAAELESSHGIAVRAGAHCAPLLHQRFGTEKQGAVRFSFSHFNTKEEIAAALGAVAAIHKKFNA